MKLHSILRSACNEFYFDYREKKNKQRRKKFIRSIEFVIVKS